MRLVIFRLLSNRLFNIFNFCLIITNNNSQKTLKVKNLFKNNKRMYIKKNPDKKEDLIKDIHHKLKRKHYQDFQKVFL